MSSIRDKRTIVQAPIGSLAAIGKTRHGTSEAWRDAQLPLVFVSSLVAARNMSGWYYCGLKPVWRCTCLPPHA
jgi:hypothetical protein